MLSTSVHLRTIVSFLRSQSQLQSIDCANSPPAPTKKRNWKTCSNLQKTIIENLDLVCGEKSQWLSKESFHQSFDIFQVDLPLVRLSSPSCSPIRRCFSRALAFFVSVVSHLSRLPVICLSSLVSLFRQSPSDVSIDGISFDFLRVRRFNRKFRRRCFHQFDSIMRIYLKQKCAAIIRNPPVKCGKAIEEEEKKTKDEIEGGDEIGGAATI